MKPAFLPIVAACLLQAACADRHWGPVLIEGTGASGLDFEHNHGGVGNRELPETMGGGVALLDYDSDGDVDVYFAQSGSMRTQRARTKRKSGRNQLFANDGSGHFTRVAGAADGGYGQGVACGDYDGDGRDDLLSLNWGANRLYRNLGSKFREVSAAVGLEPVDEWSISAAFFDAEGDGDLDLYVVNYLIAEPGSHLRMGDPSGFPGYPHPDRFPGQADRFYVNQDGSFSDRTLESGLHRPSGKGLGVVPTDIDLDGLTDLYVANDSTPNFLFHNLGELNFEEIGLRLGVAYNEDGQTEAGMGLDTGDVDGDGDFDLIVTNLDGETNTLYRNELKLRRPGGEIVDGRGTFSDVTQSAGLGDVSKNLVGFGVLFSDLDLDGHLDLLVVNGHVLDNARVLSDIRTYAQPNQLFMGDGIGHFAVPTPELAIPGLARPTVSRGSACADLNGDGALDFLIATNNGSPQLFLGNPRPTAHLALSLQGPPGNHHGLGSTIWLELKNGDRQLIRIESARSYASASFPVHIGGLPAPVRAVEVLWPGGRKERWTDFGQPFEGKRSLAYGSGR